VNEFRSTRADGRPDWQVIVELVGESDYGTTWTDADLIAALQIGVEDKITRLRAQAASRTANVHLLRDHKRCLRRVKHVGYRVIESSEHVSVADDRRARAGRQVRRAAEVLEGTDLSRLDQLERDALRAAHDHLSVVDAVMTRRAELTRFVGRPHVPGNAPGPDTEG
jgi:hypothetical protein